MITKDDAIVSLTSWKQRIKTVGKTIFTIYKHCNCHICLTLSTNEFPKQEAELPEDLLLMVDSGILEILWVKENLKCFKKILYCMQKYPDKVIIAADDDCLYQCDYVQRLIDEYNAHPNTICTYKRFRTGAKNFGHGPACLYPPNCFKDAGLKNLACKEIVETWHDDVYYGMLAYKMGIPINGISDKTPYKFHDATSPLSRGMTKGISTSISICDKHITI